MKGYTHKSDINRLSGGYTEKDMEAERPVQTSKIVTVGIVIRR